jgi:hypothetical protein
MAPATSIIRSLPWILVTFVLLLVGVSPSASTQPSAPVQRATYPYAVYPQFTDAEIKRREDDFRRRNPDAERVVLDAMGLVFEVDWQNLTPRPHSWEERDVAFFRSFVMKNADYLGIDDPATVARGLRVSTTACSDLTQEVKTTGGDTLPWRYNYAPYWPAGLIELCSGYNGYGGYGSYGGYGVHGHWWPKALIPALPALSVREVQDKLVGKGYVYYERVGPPSGWTDCWEGPPWSNDPRILPAVVPTQRRGFWCGNDYIEHSVAIRANDLTVYLIPLVLAPPVPQPREMRLAYALRFNLPMNFVEYIDAMTGADLGAGSNVYGTWIQGSQYDLATLTPDSAYLTIVGNRLREVILRPPNPP